MNPIANPGVRTAISAAIAALLIFYFPKLQHDTTTQGVEIALVWISGWLMRAPGDGIQQPLTKVAPKDPKEGD